MATSGAGSAPLPQVLRPFGFLLNLTKQQRTVMLTAVVGALVARRVYRNASAKPGAQNTATETAARGKKGTKANVDMVFVRRLRHVLSIAVPGVRSKEAFYLAMLSVLLLTRTALSVVMSNIQGQSSKSFVSRDWQGLYNAIWRFFLMSFPTAACNASLKYFQAMLALAMRCNLSEKVNGVYLEGVNFYKAANLGGSARIDNPDQRVTADIEKFSEEVADLYNHSVKPAVDVVLYTVTMSNQVGWQGPALMYVYFFVSSALKRSLMPSFGRLVAEESRLEGKHRVAHTRLISNSEEIAFYNGSTRERGIIHEALVEVRKHVKKLRVLRSLMNVFDNLVVKYWASIVGWGVVLSAHWLDLPQVRNKSTAELTVDYLAATHHLTALNQGVGELIGAGNKLGTIAGYTARVTELLEQIHRLNTTANTPFQVREKVEETGASRVAASSESFLTDWKLHVDDPDVRRRRHEKHEALNPSSLSKTQGGGVIEEAELIRFEEVDLVSPDGLLLVSKLSFEVFPGSNVMVTGPNGCGKSSLFRVIGELWPLQCGRMQKPPREDVLFVPQKPYLVLGSLRDQIIYPHTKEDMADLGVTDEHLAGLLKVVDPAGIILKTWKWDEKRDWFLAFSGGQKQRVAMARLFYHRPRFAILDECTSAVSAEVEDLIYNTCKLLGITIFTVSHRPSLKKHHDYVLAFDGRGSWEMAKNTER